MTPGNRGVSPRAPQRWRPLRVPDHLAMGFDGRGSPLFAGEDTERSRYYPEDEQFLLEMEPLVRHYDVAEFCARPGAELRPGMIVLPRRRGRAQDRLSAARRSSRRTLPVCRRAPAAAGAADGAGPRRRAARRVTRAGPGAQRRRASALSPKPSRKRSKRAQRALHIAQLVVLADARFRRRGDRLAQTAQLSTRPRSLPERRPHAAAGDLVDLAAFRCAPRRRADEILVAFAVDHRLDHLAHLRIERAPDVEARRRRVVPTPSTRTPSLARVLGTLTNMPKMPIEPGWWGSRRCDRRSWRSSNHRRPPRRPWTPPRGLPAARVSSTSRRICSEANTSPIPGEFTRSTSALTLSSRARHAIYQGGPPPPCRAAARRR